MSMNPFGQFNGPAQDALSTTYRLVMQGHHSQLDVEPLLLALLMQPQGFASQAVDRLKIDRAELIAAIEKELTGRPQVESDNKTGTAPASAFITPRVRQVFTQANAEREKGQAEFITPRDLFVAIVANPDDPAAMLLKNFGLDREKLTQAETGKVEQVEPENPVQASHPVEVESSPLTHFNEAGRARMVDVSEKEVTGRRAVARGEIHMQPETLALIREGRAKKGDVLAVAQVAGIMAAKKTSEIIPMCHPLMLSGIDLHFDYDLENSAVLIEAEVKTSGQTGVEMEALTAVSAAALTIYDMVKASDKGMRIEAIRLAHKSGGKSGTFEAE